MLLCVCSVTDKKSGNNKTVAHEAIAECLTDILTTHRHLLRSVTEQTHGKMECIKKETKKIP